MNILAALRKAVREAASAHPLLAEALAVTPVAVARGRRLTAETNGEVIVVGAEFAVRVYSERGLRGLTALIAHEALHVVLRHVERVRRILSTHCIACSMAVNAILDAMVDYVMRRVARLSNIDISPDGVTLSNLREKLEAFGVPGECADSVSRIVESGGSLEEAIAALAKCTQCAKVSTPQRGEYARVAGLPLDVAGQLDYPSIVDEESVVLVLGGVLAARTGAGLSRAGRRAILDLEAEWAARIASMLRRLAPGGVRRTWSKPSKKRFYEAPGSVASRRPRLAALIDVSGSVFDEETLSVLASAVFRAAKLLAAGEITVMLWDTRVKDVKRAKSIEQLRRILFEAEWVGGGGTLLAPALEALLCDRRRYDVVIVASDWMLADDEDKVEELLGRLKRRSRIAAVAVTWGVYSGVLEELKRRNLIDAYVEFDARAFSALREGSSSEEW